METVTDAIGPLDSLGSHDSKQADAMQMHWESVLEDPGSTIPAEDVADSLDSVVDWVRARLCCGLGQIEAANAARSWLVSSSAQDRFATASVLFVSFCHIFFKLCVSSLLLAY